MEKYEFCLLVYMCVKLGYHFKGWALAGSVWEYEAGEGLLCLRVR
jgi:hypothetical protein